MHNRDGVPRTRGHGAGTLPHRASNLSEKLAVQKCHSTRQEFSAFIDDLRHGTFGDDGPVMAAGIDHASSITFRGMPCKLIIVTGGGLQ